MIWLINDCIGPCDMADLNDCIGPCDMADLNECMVSLKRAF